jgi:hypothetical protein
MRSKITLAVVALAALFGTTSFASAQNAPGSPPAVGPAPTGSTQTGTTTGTAKPINGQPGNTGMVKGVKPDPSGQGGSGPGSDQGGTRVTPGNMK